MRVSQQDENDGQTDTIYRVPTEESSVGTAFMLSAGVRFKVVDVLVLLLLLLTVSALHAQDATPEAETPQAGDEREDDSGITQVYVPAGCFMRGTSEEEAEYAATLDAPGWTLGRLSSEQPQHEVCLTEGYWIDKYEVTNEAFAAFVEAGGYTTEAYWSPAGLSWLKRQNVDNLPKACANDDQPDHPRACITWHEADAYARWRGGSLPTEAQWEFAARGEESLIYPWGNEWDTELANVVDSTSTTPVGSYPDGASWVGALDMSGNVMEWVNDWLAHDYKSVKETDDPTGPERGSIKVEKGGWWGSNAVAARSAYRHFEDPPTYQDHHIGFRVASTD